MKHVVVCQAVVLVTLAVMCRSETTVEHCDGDVETCHPPASVPESHTTGSSSAAPQDTTATRDTVPETSTSSDPNTDPCDTEHGTTTEQKCQGDSQTTGDINLDFEMTPQHDTATTQGPQTDPQTISDSSSDLENDPHPETAQNLQTDSQTFHDPKYDLRLFQLCYPDIYIDHHNETKLDLPTARDPETDPEGSQDTYKTDCDCRPTVNPGHDSQGDTRPQDTYKTECECGAVVRSGSDTVLKSMNETVQDSSHPLARQGKRIPKAVGADKFPRKWSTRFSRSSRKPKPGILNANVLHQTVFTVKKARITRAVSEDVQLTFSEMLVNMGDAFMKTGAFYAPKSAGYFFAYHATARENNRCVLELRKNRRRVAQAWMRRGMVERGANTVFLELDRGDLITLHILKGGALYEADDAHTTFTGFLFNLRRRSEV